MAYDFEKDKSAKSFQMELNNETIMTAFITTDEEADGELPDLGNGVYGGIGYGCMGPDFEFLGSGGGGGDSDFATCNVTMTNEKEDVACNISIPCVYRGQGPGGYVEFALNEVYMEPGDTVNAEIILYKGIAAGLVTMPIPLPTIAVTGSITVDHGNFKITGDGTITLS